MRKKAIATTLIMSAAIAFFVADMAKEGHFNFVSTKDIQKILPNTVPPQFAEILKGNTKDCLTVPNQTKPVTILQIRTLRQLTDKEQATALLGNAYCQTATGFKYLTESGSELIIKFDKVLDHDFGAERTTNKLMLSRPPEKGMVRQKESGKDR